MPNFVTIRKCEQKNYTKILQVGGGGGGGEEKEPKIELRIN